MSASASAQCNALPAMAMTAAPKYLAPPPPQPSMGSVSVTAPPFHQDSNGQAHGPGPIKDAHADQQLLSHHGNDFTSDGYDYGLPPPPHVLFDLDPQLAASAALSSVSSQCFPPPSAYLSHSTLSPFSLTHHGYTHHYDEHDLELELLAFHRHQQELSSLDAFTTAATTTSVAPLFTALTSSPGNGSEEPVYSSPQPFLTDPPPQAAATATPASGATSARTKSSSTAKRKPRSNPTTQDASSTSPVITRRSTTATTLGPEAAQHISKNRGQRWSEHELATLRTGVAKHGRNFVAIYNDHGPNGKVDTALARIPSVRAIHAKWLRLTMVERQLAKAQGKGGIGGQEAGEDKPEEIGDPSGSE